MGHDLTTLEKQKALTRSFVRNKGNFWHTGFQANLQYQSPLLRGPDIEGWHYIQKQV